MMKSTEYCDESTHFLITNTKPHKHVFTGKTDGSSKETWQEKNS